MKSIRILTFLLFSGCLLANSQEQRFTIEKELKHTPVISQGSTGTCWSFATTSFLESEIMRKGFPQTDLSEMYNVYNAYKNKSFRYLLYQGNINYSCGGQAHDVLDVVREKGLMTNESLPGIKVKDRFNHNKLDSTMMATVTELNRKKKEDIDVSDLKIVEPILEKYIGKIRKKMKFGGAKIKPSDLRDKLMINPDDYVEFTSYSHHPFYQSFVLEVPDN